MRKIKLGRGKAALEVPNISSQEVWTKAFLDKFKKEDYKYHSKFWGGKIFSCEELRQETDRALTSIDPNNGRTLRNWGREILDYLGLPIE